MSHLYRTLIPTNGYTFTTDYGATGIDYLADVDHYKDFPAKSFPKIIFHHPEIQNMLSDNVNLFPDTNRCLAPVLRFEDNLREALEKCYVTEVKM